MSVPPAPPLLLASTSPQRRAILTQLGIPFDVVAPRYDEHDPAEADATELVCRHARGKAESVAGEADGRLVLGVDTTVVARRPHLRQAGERGRRRADARGALGADARGGVRVVPHRSGLGGGRGGRDARHVPRADAARPRGGTSRRGEWEGRAGGYAIQGLGGALVERIEGDYLNIVGLPGALLVRLLAERFPGTYGFG